jgi:hypothetical protein
MATGPSVTIDLRGLENVRRGLDQQAMVRDVAGIIKDLGLIAQRGAKEKVARDTGALGRSISLESRPLQARVFTDRNLTYARVVEEGRNAGSRMPPPNALRGWARRHGMGTDPGTLFVLARAIARRGTRGRFFMRWGYGLAERALPGKLRAVESKLESRMR